MSDSTNDQCSRMLPSGQCENEARPGSSLCSEHEGAIARRKREQRTYHLTEVRAAQRLDNLANDDKLYSLKEEIAVVRMMLQSFLASMKFDSIDENDKVQRLLQAPLILRMLDQIQKLVTSGSELEVKFDRMLNMETAQNLFSGLVDTMAEVLREHGVDEVETIVEEITTRFTEAYSKTKNQKD